MKIPMMGLAIVLAAQASFAAAPPLPRDSVYQADIPMLSDRAERFSWRDQRGQPQIVSMFYTSCRFTCPMLVDGARAVQSSLTPDERARLHVTFISLDPGRDTTRALAQLRDVGACDLVDAVIAEPGNDETLQHAPVTLGRARLQAEVDVLFLEALGELLDRDGAPVGISRGGGVLTIPGRGDDPDRPCARLLTGEHGTGPEADAPRPAAGSVLNDVSLATARKDAHTKARQVSIPDEVLLCSCFCGLDYALGEFRHGCDPSICFLPCVASDFRKHPGSKRERVGAHIGENDGGR